MNHTSYHARPFEGEAITQQEYKNGIIKKQKLVRLAANFLRFLTFSAGIVAVGAAIAEADPVAATALGTGLFSFIGTMKLVDEHTNLDKRYHTVTELDPDGALYSKHPNKKTIQEEIDAYDRNADLFE